MNSSNELFELISSMTANEKRYFKLFASAQKGEKQYVRLFDLIDKNGITTNTELIGRSDLPVEKNKIAFVKNYLYKLVSRSLIRAKDDSSDLDTRLRNIYIWCKILYDKALFGQYFRYVQMGKQLSKKHERYGMLMEFIEIERTLSKKEDLMSMKDEEYYEEERSVLEEIRNINEIRYIVTKLLTMQREIGVIRTKEQRKILLGIEEKLIELGKRKSQCNTFMERHCFAMQIMYDVRNEMKNAYDLAGRRKKIIDEALHVFENSIQDFVRQSTAEMISTAIDNGMLREAKNLLKVSAKNKRVQAIDEINRCIYEIKIRMAESGRMTDKQFTEFVNDSYKHLLNLTGKVTVLTLNILIFRLACISVERGCFEKALEILDQLMLRSNIRHTPFLESYARILFAIVHFELGNYKLLKFLVPSTMKLLKSRNILYKTERTMLLYLKSSAAATTIEVKLNVMEEYAHKLSDVMKDELEKNSVEYFDYLWYLEQRLRRSRTR